MVMGGCRVSHSNLVHISTAPTAFLGSASADRGQARRRFIALPIEIHDCFVSAGCIGADDDQRPHAIGAHVIVDLWPAGAGSIVWPRSASRRRRFRRCSPFATSARQSGAITGERCSLMASPLSGSNAGFVREVVSLQQKLVAISSSLRFASVLYWLGPARNIRERARVAWAFYLHDALPERERWGYNFRFEIVANLWLKLNRSSVKGQRLDFSRAKSVETHLVTAAWPPGAADTALCVRLSCSWPGRKQTATSNTLPRILPRVIGTPL